MPQTVAEILIGVLEQIGVRHEEGGALAAADQAKLTGGLGVCCGTTGPGSTHLVAGLYEASSMDGLRLLPRHGTRDTSGQSTSAGGIESLTLEFAHGTFAAPG